MIKGWSDFYLVFLTLLLINIPDYNNNFKKFKKL